MSTIRTRALLPSRLNNLKTLRENVKTDHVIVLPLEQTRFVWQEIRPCIFRDDDDDNNNNNSSFDDTVACHMMNCLFEFLRKHGRAYQIKKDKMVDYRSKENTSDECADSQDTTEDTFWDRTLPWRPRKTKFIMSRECTILIVPSTIKKVEFSWEERLIGLEHNLIRAQSVAGLISTLGGGYFMTRRLQTANALAREQQRIAVLLGNKEMYYKCIINQAYNEIYGGRFKLAKFHILQVWMALANEKHFDEKLVLQNMCKSAMLFRQRVRKSNRQIPTDGGKGSRMVDDFSRIRVVRDQSSHRDLTITPFAHAKIF